MPVRRNPPPTDEGWYALHDFRRIDWDAWREASERTRERALAEVIDHLDTRLAVEDADVGASALYSILGDKADLLILHLRPTTAHLGALERQFELTEFAEYTERTTSFVSVTEASGYSERARDYFEGELDENTGLANYMQTRLKPQIPDATHVCFYPMSKRRHPDANWYDLPFEERAEHMKAHGDIGRDYGGRVVQMITGAIALDDWEWGVTLWGDDLVDMKDLLYEMRFDPSTSRFGEFGQFYVGRRFPPADLPALLAGAAVPTGETTPESLDTRPTHPADTVPQQEDTAQQATHQSDEHETETHHAETAESETEQSAKTPVPEETTAESAAEEVEPEDVQTRLGMLGLREGEHYESDNYAVVVYSRADAQELADEVDDLRGHMEGYDSHIETVVRAESGRSAVASIWETDRAAGIAEGFLVELPGVTRSIRGPLGGSGETTEQNHTGGQSEADHASESGQSESGETDEDHTVEASGDIREELADLDVYAGQPHGEDIYALVLYSKAEREVLAQEVADLRDGFDRYDTHEETNVYEDPESGTTAVVSLWETQDAANTASEYLVDLPDVVGWADDTDGFATMGMFYTVKPEHREDFVEKFETVGGLLTDMDGHRETALLVNTNNENDMFIASQWDSKDAAMDFFRSDAFSDTVHWGRDILADRPRHVFLA